MCKVCGFAVCWCPPDARRYVRKSDGVPFYGRLGGTLYSCEGTRLKDGGIVKRATAEDFDEVRLV